MALIYLGLGSNLGDPAANLREALRRLPASGLTVIKVSDFFRSKPYGPVAQPDFINAVCLSETGLNPLCALRALKNIEQAMGRLPAPRWGPRQIDLDILLYDNLILNSEELTIPHPDMLNRRFVLAPLVQLDGALTHPISGRAVAGHLAALDRIK